MNCFIKTLVGFVIIAFNAYSQEISDSIKASQQPTGLIKSLSPVLEDFDFYLDLQSLNKTFPLNSDPNTRWLWTSYAISNSDQATSQPNLNFSDMTLPLYQKYKEDSKFNPFRYALGMAQIGAVGYLAYKHIKKYGFLRK
jgi:hypothetical protein